MRIIISPAKKMNMDTDSLPIRALPRFLGRTEELLALLRAMSPEELKALWKCNDRLVRLNVERLADMNLRSQLTPAILAYEGIQYQYMAPGVFTGEELEYVQERLRILPGFYGVLRPFGGGLRCRLEMQARLNAPGGKDLYEFWGDTLAAEVFGETDCVVNLASREYSQCLSRYVPSGARFITCVFGERKDGKIVEKGTMCKMARGEMVRYLAENRAEDPEQMRDFDRLQYRFSPADSDGHTYTFIREVSQHADHWNEGA